jgi:hypothetical protein
MDNQNVDKLVDAASKIADSLATTSEHILEVYQKAFFYEGIIGSALCILFAGMITFAAYKMIAHIKKEVDDGEMEREFGGLSSLMIVVIYLFIMTFNIMLFSENSNYIASPEAHAIKQYMADVGRMMHGG